LFARKTGPRFFFAAVLVLVAADEFEFCVATAIEETKRSDSAAMMSFFIFLFLFVRRVRDAR